jgi:hypothetical protein
MKLADKLYIRESTRAGAHIYIRNHSTGSYPMAHFLRGSNMLIASRLCATAIALKETDRATAAGTVSPGRDVKSVPE